MLAYPAITSSADITHLWTIGQTGIGNKHKPKQVNKTCTSGKIKEHVLEDDDHGGAIESVNMMYVYLPYCILHAERLFAL